MVVVIEGITNVGKSTLCEMLSLRFSSPNAAINLNTILNQEPFLTKLKLITHPNNFIFNPVEELLLYTTRLKRKSEIIRELVAENPNSLIFVDRYIHSVVAFFRGVRKIDLEDIENLIINIVKIPFPDIVFFVDGSLETIEKRMTGKSVSRKNLGLATFFEQYRKSFIDGDGKYCRKMYILDGNRPLENIAEEIYFLLRLEEKTNS